MGISMNSDGHDFERLEAEIYAVFVLDVFRQIDRSSAHCINRLRLSSSEIGTTFRQ